MSNYNSNINTTQNDQNTLNNELTNPKKFNKKILIIIGVIIIIAIVCLFIFKNNQNNNVSQDETLTINELKGLYNFEVEVLSVEDNYAIVTYLETFKGVAVKLNIKNLGDELIPALLTFNLVDDSNNRIEGAGLVSQSQVTNDNIINLSDRIPKGNSISGYLFFYNYENDVSLDNVSKLQINVPKNIYENQKVEYTNYFINLN